MGKSTASCFKIISCGSDSIDHDDLQTPDGKVPSDRRRWSFRKRSPRHHVLSNSVISAAASANKEKPEPTSVNSQVQPDLTVPEKTSVIKWTEEKTEMSAPQLDLNLPETQASREDDFQADAAPDEPSIIVMQSVIRGFLAQRVLSKQKSIVKLQAVVRGHLVRTHAVGTLRCVQAIIKMQALVRARHARRAVEGSDESPKQRETSGQSKKEAKSSGTYTYVSLEKLLTNAFARQLMEATPKTQPINIKCDPLRSDSAWKWLERWMSVSSVSSEEPQESEAAMEQHEAYVGHSDRDGEDNLVQIISKSTDSEFGVDASTGELNDENSTIYNMNDLNLHPGKSISPSSSHSKLHNNDQSISSGEVTESAPTEMQETDLVDMVQVKRLSEKEDIGNDQDARDSEIFSTEQSEAEVKNISRKASNPAFIAAQSKFEELSLATTSAKLTTSSDPGEDSSLDKVFSSTDEPFRSKDTGLAEDVISNASAIQRGGSESSLDKISASTDQPFRSKDSGLADNVISNASAVQSVGSESSLDKVSSSTDQTFRSKDTGLADNAISNASAVQRGGSESSLDKVSSSTDQTFGCKDTGLADNAISNASAVQRCGSECGTELSISSTLDSSDRSEARVNDTEIKIKASDETDHPKTRENLELEAESIVQETDPSCTSTDKFDGCESVNSVPVESLDSVIPADSPQLEKKPEADPSHLQLVLGSEAGHPVNKTSPEASPKSHVTVPESQATLPSRVSVKPNRSKGARNEANHKNRSSSANKNLSNHNQVSSTSSLEQLQEHKTGKRRNSFGSAKPDHREQEPRDSSCSNSLPSYMQATESARAKAIANGSPRSSPDAHDKDIYIKKRHSLPGINERQGSPRIHRSLSQAQQNVKGNANHSPKDRKWRQ